MTNHAKEFKRTTSFPEQVLRSAFVAPPRQTASSALQKVDFGVPGSLQQRVLFQRIAANSRKSLEYDAFPCSPWLDVRIFPKGKPSPDSPLVVNAVCLTPVNSWIKYEVATDEPFTPVRIHSLSVEPGHFLPSHFSAPCSSWSVAFLPQTVTVEKDVGDRRHGFSSMVTPRGNLAPLQVVVVHSDRKASTKTGDVIRVRVLGSFGDDSKSSCTLVGVSVKDKKFASAKSIVDLFGIEPYAMSLLQSWIEDNNGSAFDQRDECFGHRNCRKKCSNLWPLPAEWAEKMVNRSHSRWKTKIDQFELKSAWSVWWSRKVKDPQTVNFDTLWLGYTSGLGNDIIPCFPTEKDLELSLSSFSSNSSSSFSSTNRRFKVVKKVKWMPLSLFKKKVRGRRSSSGLSRGGLGLCGCLFPLESISGTFQSNSVIIQLTSSSERQKNQTKIEVNTRSSQDSNKISISCNSKVTTRRHSRNLSLDAIPEVSAVYRSPYHRDFSF